MRLYRLNKAIEAKTNLREGGNSEKATKGKARPTSKKDVSAKGPKRRIAQISVSENGLDAMGEKAGKSEAEDDTHPMIQKKKKKEVPATGARVEVESVDESDELLRKIFEQLPRGVQVYKSMPECMSKTTDIR